MKKMLKLALVSAIVLGIIMSLFNYHFGLVQTAIAFGIFSVLGFVGGFLFGGILVLFDKYSFAKQLSKTGQKLTRSHQSVGVILTLSYKETFEKCIKALKNVKRYSNHKEEKNKIIAKTKIGWKSFGEIITMVVNKKADHETEILIDSIPKLPTTLWDYGKNSENIETIKNFLLNKY